MGTAKLLTKDSLEQQLRDFERRLTIKFGAMIAAFVVVVTALVKLL
jgi:hypothetical protein